MLYPNHSFPSSLFYPQSPPIPHPFLPCFPSERGRAPRAIDLGTAHQVAIRLGASPPILRVRWSGGRKGIPKTGKSQKQPVLPLLRVPQETKLQHNHNIFAEGLSQLQVPWFVIQSLWAQVSWLWVCLWCPRPLWLLQSFCPLFHRFPHTPPNVLLWASASLCWKKPLWGWPCSCLCAFYLFMTFFKNIFPTLNQVGNYCALIKIICLIFCLSSGYLSDKCWD